MFLSPRVLLIMNFSGISGSDRINGDLDIVEIVQGSLFGCNEAFINYLIRFLKSSMSTVLVALMRNSFKIVSINYSSGFGNPISEQSRRRAGARQV